MNSEKVLFLITYLFYFMIILFAIKVSNKKQFFMKILFTFNDFEQKIR